MKGVKGRVHDLVWSICEETSLVLPAHEKLEAGHRTIFLAGGSKLRAGARAGFHRPVRSRDRRQPGRNLHLLGERLSPK